MTTFVDMFGSFLHSDPLRREKDYLNMVKQAYNLGICNYQAAPADLYYLVKHGFLSPISASYFVVGGASPMMLRIYQEFYVFLCNNFDLQDFKIYRLWQKQKESAKAESMCLSRSAVPGFDALDVDFSEERLMF